MIEPNDGHLEKISYFPNLNMEVYLAIFRHYRAYIWTKLWILQKNLIFPKKLYWYYWDLHNWTEWWALRKIHQILNPSKTEWWQYFSEILGDKEYLLEFLVLLRGADREPRAREAGPEASIDLKIGPNIYRQPIVGIILDQSLLQEKYSQLYI